MQPEPGSPADWIRFAKSDLALAITPASDNVLLETLCFHAQQAVEKSIKAVLVHFNIPAPRIHSIERLIDLLPPNIPRASDLLASAKLTAYGTIFRYPGEKEPVTEEDYREAIKLAELVLAWAEGTISK